MEAQLAAVEVDVDMQRRNFVDAYSQALALRGDAQEKKAKLSQREREIKDVLTGHLKGAGVTCYIVRSLTETDARGTVLPTYLRIHPVSHFDAVNDKNISHGLWTIDATQLNTAFEQLRKEREEDDDAATVVDDGDQPSTADSDTTNVAGADATDGNNNKRKRPETTTCTLPTAAEVLMRAVSNSLRAVVHHVGEKIVLTTVAEKGKGIGKMPRKPARKRIRGVMAPEVRETREALMHQQSLAEYEQLKQRYMQSLLPPDAPTGVEKLCHEWFQLRIAMDVLAKEVAQCNLAINGARGLVPVRFAPPTQASAGVPSAAQGFFKASARRNTSSSASNTTKPPKGNVYLDTFASVRDSFIADLVDEDDGRAASTAITDSMGRIYNVTVTTKRSTPKFAANRIPEATVPAAAALLNAAGVSPAEPYDPVVHPATFSGDDFWYAGASAMYEYVMADAKERSCTTRVLTLAKSTRKDQIDADEAAHNWVRRIRNGSVDDDIADDDDDYDDDDATGDEGNLDG
jgi:hypothetical protein